MEKDYNVTAAHGPLRGVRVLEMAGLGPAPYAAMLLSDLGAEVVRVDRVGSRARIPVNVLTRGRVSIALDLKSPGDMAICRSAIGASDVLLEGFRPGVMERLGLGPDWALEVNPRLIYGRMTGWGQSGPLAQSAGHDINYVALSGALASFGEPGRRPMPPMNLLGDFGGGSMFLIMGVLAALYERDRSGRGQVVDAAIVDGVASLMAMYCGLMASNPAAMARQTAPYSGSQANYRCYECADGRFVSVGALEPEFHRELLEKLGLPADLRGTDQEAAELEARFRQRSRDEWCGVFERSDSCFAPVLELDEAQAHPHMRERGVYITHNGLAQPAPAPRLSRTPGAIQSGPASPGVGGRERLRSWGVET